MDAMELWELLFRIYAVLLALLLVSFLLQRPTSSARPITILGAVVVIVPLSILAALIRSGWEPF